MLQDANGNKKDNFEKEKNKTIRKGLIKINMENTRAQAFINHIKREDIFK